MENLLKKMFIRKEGNMKKDSDVTQDNHCRTWFAKIGGFTLAEVLITLGIIGVVAAITIPNVIKNYKKHEIATRLKQNYNLLQNAYNMAIAEYGDPDNWDELTLADSNPSRPIVEKYITPYLKLTKPLDKYTLQDLGYKTPIYYQDGENLLHSIDYSSSKAVLANGTVLVYIAGIQKTNSNKEKVYYGIKMFFDLNGTAGPNTCGKDVFEYIIFLSKGQRVNMGEVGFNFNADTRDLVVGGNYSREELINHCKPDSGYEAVYCGALIMQSGWKFPKDYPLSF